MDHHHESKVSTNQKQLQSREELEEEETTNTDLRRGPWTVDEDFTLINYVAHHGEGRWNSLAKCAGLRRTGKSCRLRWLNYLRPDVRRGNITLEEQLLILELHSRWGNRWSKIAQHLPGRTDNEIKNYWRTRVQKHAKQLNCDVNSKQFKDTMRYLWMPRLVERIQAAAGQTPAAQPPPPPPEAAAAGASSDQSSFGTPASDMSTDNNNCYNNYYYNNNNQLVYADDHHHQQPPPLMSPAAAGYGFNGGMDFSDQSSSQLMWMDGGDQVSDGLWNDDDVWFLQQQFYNN